MPQKILKVGTSAAVTIPKKSLEELGLKIGDDVTLEVERKKRTVTIRPIRELSPKDKRIAELTADFIKHYRKDLEALSRE